MDLIGVVSTVKVTDILAGIRLERLFVPLSLYLYQAHQPCSHSTFKILEKTRPKATPGDENKEFTALKCGCGEVRTVLASTSHASLRCAIDRGKSSLSRLERVKLIHPLLHSRNRALLHGAYTSIDDSVLDYKVNAVGGAVQQE